MKKLKNGELVDMTAQEIAEFEASQAVAPPATGRVTMRQAREALIRAGMFAKVDSAIAAMPGIDGDIARNWWERAASVERGHPITASMAAMLGLTDAQLDALFTQAAAL